MSDGTEGAGEAGRRTGGSALKAMVSFFTLWHMDITQEDVDEMERSFGLVPVVGLFFGAILIVEMLALGWLNYDQGYGSAMLMAVVALATVYIGSKFIHFDGLTDFGDGMIVSGTREDHVRALKDTLVGAGGIGVALTVVLLSVAVYSTAQVYMLVVFAPIAEILVKNAMVAAAAYGKPGNGMAGRQVSMTTTHSLMVSTVVSLVLCVVVAVIASLLYNACFDPLEVDLVNVMFCIVFGLAMSIVAGYIMARKSNDVFGMVNGDILGATNEVSRPLVMLVMIAPYICWLW